MDYLVDEVDEYISSSEASTSIGVIPTVVDINMPSEEVIVEDDGARVEPETVEITDSDDDTRSLPPEELPENFRRSLPEDQKGNKREHEDDEELESCKKQRNNSDDEEEGNTCPICLDAWSISGEHRVCCLSCGHLFGHSCLLRWLESIKAKQRKCPTCKRKASISDIRFLYVKKLIAIDSTDLEVLKAQLNDSNEENNNLRRELTRVSMQKDRTISTLRHEVQILKIKYQNATLQQRANTSDIKILQFSMDKSLEISDKGGCRVCDYSPLSKTMCVSSVSPNPIFSGFGVRKVSLTGYRTLAFIPTHVKAIRDLAFHKDYLLTVSLDTKAKITSMVSNQEVMNFSCDDPLWSCCWDATDSNVFYVGHAVGCVSVYDIRNPGIRLAKLETPGDGSPVVSLACTHWEAGEAMRYGGLLCCKLNSCSAFEKKYNAVVTYENRPLGIEGPFMSLRYNSATRHILISARPNQRHPYTRHTVCELSQDGPGAALLCNTVHTFVGAKAQGMLSRSCMLTVGDSIYAAAHHQTDNNVSVWSLESGSKVGSVPAHLPILDSCSVKCYDSNYLVTLNEKKLDFFKVL